MPFKNFHTKASVVVVFTGEGKGKTSASLGLLIRALGADWRVAYIQFIKHWEVNEHHFIKKIQPLFEQQLTFFIGGKGFYKAGDLSAQGISESVHKKAALESYQFAYQAAISGEYNLVICDEINNAVHDGLISQAQLQRLIKNKSPKTSICLTGRDFPDTLLALVDIATNMSKIKHHFDDNFLANPGIDY